MDCCRVTGFAVRRLVAIFAMFACAAECAPVTVSFDNVDASGGDVPIVSPYAGLSWTNFTAYTTTPGFDGFNNGIVSLANAAYSGGQLAGPVVTPVVGEITSSGLFNFISADLGSGYYDALSLTIEGLRGGTALFQQTVTLNTLGAQAFTFNFNAIDTLLFASSATGSSTDPFACGTFNCTQFTVDDFKFLPVTSSNTVSEPTSLALAVIALLAATRFRRLNRGQLQRGEDERERALLAFRWTAITPRRTH